MSGYPGAAPAITHAVNWSASRLVEGELGAFRRVLVSHCGIDPLPRCDEAFPWWDPSCPECRAAVAASLLVEDRLRSDP